MAGWHSTSGPFPSTKRDSLPHPPFHSVLQPRNKTHSILSLYSLAMRFVFKAGVGEGISEITGIFALGTNVSSQRHILPRRHTNTQRFDRVKAFPFSVCLLGTR